ncbi:MAG: hypothetical protein JWP14_2665 [Frankiales bacterium]|nr:hypothetical protein [Frankiales bacterium]
MDTQNTSDAADSDAARTQYLHCIKKTAGWLGRVALGRVIEHFLREWWS